MNKGQKRRPAQVMTSGVSYQDLESGLTSKGDFMCANCDRFFPTHAAMCGHKRTCKPGAPFVPGSKEPSPKSGRTSPKSATLTDTIKTEMFDQAPGLGQMI